MFRVGRSRYLPPTADTADQLVCMRLALEAWERGLVLGSRSCHDLLFKSIMSKLPLVFPPLFHSYLKGATVQLPGQFYWQRRLGTLDTSSRDGLQPSFREAICGWRPYIHFDRTWVDRFWHKVGWMTDIIPIDTAFHLMFEKVKLLLRRVGLYRPLYHPQLMVGQMLPLQAAINSPLLALVVDSDLSLEKYSLPLVQALIAAHWGVHHTVYLFGEALVSLFGGRLGAIEGRQLVGGEYCDSAEALTIGLGIFPSLVFSS